MNYLIDLLPSTFWQYGFFGHAGASYIGVVVVKAGDKIVAVSALADASGATQLPVVNVNGDEVVVTDGDRTDISGSRQTSMQVSVLAPGSSTFSFEFISGASLSVEVMYSSVLQRQVQYSEHLVQITRRLATVLEHVPAGLNACFLKFYRHAPLLNGST
jgi:hypothetical protein